MNSVYFLHVTNSAKHFFSSPRRMLLHFQPIRGMLKFCLEITKEEDCLFIRIVYWDSRNLGSLRTLTEIFFLTFGKMLYFSTLLKTLLLLCYPAWIVISHLKKERYHFFFGRHCLACLYYSLCRIGTFPHYGFTQHLWHHGAVVQLKTSRHYWNINISSTITTEKLKLLGEGNLWKFQTQIL